MIKVTYLDHSGFAITTEDAILVFDFLRDPSHALHKLLKENPTLPVTFFVSHHHPDHFNADIFEMAQDHKRTYVISNDELPQNIPSTLRVAGMSPGDVIEDIPGASRVKAYGSTDVGVSYFVTLTDGHTVFHAGDLNLWHWRDENTPAAAVRATADFTKVLNRIESEVSAIDIAMFPVDPRQGTDFAEGARLFTNGIRVANFFPMHFWGEYKEACLFSSYIEAPSTAAHCLHSPGESIELYK
ncbi:MAG: MBL fold metallo-hydrolase [Muribaculaceae bacterium]|nr:MBL fold metallo-hydrolase [Muribaculaceae bacterium]